MKSIYQYNDPVTYLSDFLNEKKELEEQFSLRRWAKDIGLGSTAPIIDVLKRKKPLRKNLTGKIIKVLPIDKSEVLYFCALAERANSSSDEKKLLCDLILKELSPINRDTYSCYRTNDDKLFSHWIYMAILTISKVEGFILSEENIYNSLIEKVEKSLIRDALKYLIDLDLIVKNESGQLVRKYSSHSTITDLKSDSVHRYFSLVCELAKNAVDIELNKREFQAFSFTLPEDKIDLGKEIIRKCRQDLASLSNEQSENTEVYQANLMLFPITDGASSHPH